MSRRSASSGGPRDFRTGRLEAFSDGVFAIAITLLVLEIAIPAGGEEDLLGAFLDQWPSYLAYVVSFSTVGAAWLAHTAITEYVDRVDLTFIRINLGLLLVVAFVPFPTKVVAEYIDDTGAERVAVTVYGVTLLLTSVLIGVLWRYAAAHGLVRTDADDDELRYISRRSTPSLFGYLVLLGVGLFAPIAAVIGYFAIALVFIFPVARLARAALRRGPAARPDASDLG